MRRVFANEHWILDRHPKFPLLIVRRTSVGYSSNSEIPKAFDALDAAMDACVRSRFAVLIDLRESVGRNDPEFERATKGHPRRLVHGFTRAAVLVRTANGLLQVRRTAGTMAAERARAFNSEAEAMAYLFPPKDEAKPPRAP